MENIDDIADNAAGVDYNLELIHILMNQTLPPPLKK